MLITFKTLEQKQFKIEIEDTAKIKALKEKVAEEKGADQYPVAGQKLIYSGKILDDDKTISECNIDEKNFVVVMVVKQKAKPKESESSSSSSATAAAPAPAAAPAEPTSVDTTTASTTSTESTTGSSVSATASTESTTTSSATSVNTTEAAESALLTGTALESSITELMALGYSREQVMLALNRSFHNADRAAEYLLSGNIPEAPGDSEGGGDDVLGQVSDATAPVSVGGEGAGGGTTDLSFLRNLPQFQLMRNQVQDNPRSLPVLLQGIGETNPELLSLINQNQQQFISILNERPATDTDSAPASDQAGAVGDAAAGQPFQIQVTTEEKAMIDRLVGMGFPQEDVIQAFFACDKNEQLAAEFLINDTDF